MSQKIFFAAIAAFIVGAYLFWVSDKTRKDGEEWSNNLQWGYLLMLVGVFGVSANFMSFTAVLVLFVLGTGFLWFYNKIISKKNEKLIKVLKQKEDATEAIASSHKIKQVGHFVDYMRGFFPIILIVFVVRTFVVEPFQIPSGSMRPGLIVGDFILVQKYSYGIRMPITNKVIIPTSPVKRGDVAVFNYPVNPDVNYIKRIVAIPGDTVEYKGKVLTINGKTVTDIKLATPQEDNNYTEQGILFNNNTAYEEKLGDKNYRIFQDDSRPTLELGAVDSSFPFRDQCHYDVDGFTCKVPEGHYFAMGDNRDNSGDSRYWGFVPDKYLVGRAFFIWMNFSDFSRVGTTIK